MNFVDRFPLAPILQWAATRHIDLTAWKTWGDVEPEYISQVAMHRLHNLLRAQFPEQPLGLLLGSACTLDTLGLFGQIGQHCESLRQAAEIYMRYKPMATASDTRVEVDPTSAAVSIIPSPTPNPAIASSDGFRMAFAFAQTLAIFRQLLADPTITAEEVSFTHRDKRFEAEYSAYFGTPVRFGHKENRITFAGELFERPIAGAVPSTRGFLEEFALSQIQRHTAALAQDQDFVELLRIELKNAIPSGDFSEATIARRLSVSPRTLQRRLAARGMAFRTLVDQVQAQLAMALLAKPELTIDEIAAQLGYAQASSFHRAFRRWTGRTPGDARQDLLA